MPSKTPLWQRFVVGSTLLGAILVSVAIHNARTPTAPTRPVSAPSPEPALSTAPVGSDAQICHDMGVNAYHITTARDRGVPLDTLLEMYNSRAEVQYILPELRALTAAIYLGGKAGTPAEIQAATEQGCLQGRTAPKKTPKKTHR